MTDKEKDLIKKFAIYASREDSKKANVHHVNKHSNIVDYHFIYKEDEYSEDEQQSIISYLKQKPYIKGALNFLYDYYCGEAATECDDITVAAREAKQEATTFDKKGLFILSRIATTKKFNVNSIEFVDKAIDNTKIILERLEELKTELTNSSKQKMIEELKARKAAIEEELNKLNSK
ncbi:hypothetical protein [Bacteroides salyersiae]|jgi:hypothetical protein|uniref:hypothetical protein n=1 Tax=Bacteroides salyersiae TaxID=291644 RepID=UPI00101E08B9|nr:hypothetical protein [Bacteroides salyersiae]DAE60927.1 MAG TPA: hypothetical protein [Caudoviricetes sp.]